jgi:hypothetical protein
MPTQPQPQPQQQASQASVPQALQPTMGSHAATLQDWIARQLEGAALGYLSRGRELYRKTAFQVPDPQVILGNVTIAIELMLKSFVARHNPALLFVEDKKKFPTAIRVLFASPNRLGESQEWKAFDYELRTGKYRTIEFWEGFEIFKLLFPQLGQELESHFDFVNKNRNVSVHYFFPHFHKYEVDRAVYVALRLLQKYKELSQKEKWIFDISYPALSDESIDDFVKKFDEARIERVRKAQDQAREDAKKLTAPIEIDVEGLDWCEYKTTCDVCNSDALLRGDTELECAPPSEHDDGGCQLVFKAHSFRCDGCGLELKDVPELKLAGVDLVYDRSDQEDEWHRQFSDEQWYS